MRLLRETEIRHNFWFEIIYIKYSEFFLLMKELYSDSPVIMKMKGAANDGFAKREDNAPSTMI